MKKARSGFSLVEVLLATSVFGLIVTALVGGLIYGQESTALAGARSRATLLADEGLEAARNIHDSNFSSLTDGTHGLVTSGNQWIFSGTSDVTDIFTRQINISTPTTDRRQVISTVTWTQNPQRTGSVTLTTYMTNWAEAVSSTGCMTYCQSLSYPTGTCRGSPSQCTGFGETHQSGGDAQCTGGGGADTCCCTP